MKARRLNFGAGDDIILGYDNLDKKDFDFNVFPYPIKDNTYYDVKARQVLQLLENPEKVLHELWRISKPDTILKITTSHYNNKGAHNDIKTKYYFNENSFKLFCEWNKEKFELKNIYFTKTWFGKILLFEWLRKFLNLFISGIYSNIEVEIKVIK